MYLRNTAVTGFTFGLLDKVTGAPITTGTVTGYRTIDGGTQTVLTNSPTHEGNGQWSVNLTAAEMNGQTIGLVFTHADAANSYISVVTDTADLATMAATLATMTATLAAVTSTLSTMTSTLTALPNSTAEEILTIDLSGVTGEASRSVLNALRMLRNKWAVVGTTLTVYKEDDSTAAWTAAMSTGNADPVIAVDPT